MEWCAIFNWHFYAAQNNNTKKYDIPFRGFDCETGTPQQSQIQHIHKQANRNISNNIWYKSVIQRSDRRTTERGAYFGTCTVSSHVESWSLFWREISWLDQPSSHKDAYIWWCFIYICIRKIFVNGVAIWFEPISIYLITKYQHQEPPYRKKWSNVLFQQANKMEKRTLVYDIHW